MIKDVTIIIPTRADIDYLKKAVASIRTKSQYDAVKLLIGADNPSKEVSKWLSNNSKGNFDYITFEPPKNRDRQGIVNVVEKLVDKVDTTYTFYMHDDMVIGNRTLENALSQIDSKKIISSYRVEPPVYDQTPEKLIKDFGVNPDEFKEQHFLKLEEQLNEQNTDKTVEGFFAPHLFKTEEFVGYDHLFEPQSREDSDLALRFLEQDFELLTAWDSVVYHFSGKGSRKKDSQEDSDEWKKTNSKNTKNYIRKWGTLKHTKYIKPVKAPDIKISGTVLVGEEEPETFLRFLENVEPWFDELVFVFDTTQDKETVSLMKKTLDTYVDKLENDEYLQPSNFSKDKIVTLERDLNNDFAAQTNYAVEHCTHEWVMKLDVDEVFPEQMLSHLRFIIEDSIDGNPNVSVIGFPRLNFLDGKIVNDIPREHWFTGIFDQYPDNPQEIQNPDIQFRLHKSDEKWVGDVHETPESVKNRDIDKITTIQGVYIQHPKSRQKQFNQLQKYANIQNKDDEPITHFVYDSVLYTYEGITKHAREEMLELDKRGKTVYTIAERYDDEFGEEFKKFHTPFDLEKNKYVSIINQPPSRWANSQDLDNKIVYLAFEGEPRQEWVQQINQSDMIELWTPSTYCKKLFEDAGVNKPVRVIPHGVDPEVWKPKDVEKPDKFTFLAAGTFQNDRKGLDLVAKAFSNEFSSDEDVRLLFKVNKIYTPGETFNEYIHKHVDTDLDVEYMDTDLDEEEMVDLFNEAHVYVSPHRAEGFGINILNALAVGTPTIVTGATGNMDFCNEKNCLLLTDYKEKWAPFIPPYDESKWVEPSLEQLQEKMRYSYENYEQLKEHSLKKSENIRTDWTWEKAVDEILERVEEIS